MNTAVRRKQSKKAEAQMWWIIAGAIIALVVVVLILFWFQGSGGKVFGNVEGNINQLKDKDGDGVADLFDKCPCDPTIGDKFPEGMTRCQVECEVSSG